MLSTLARAHQTDLRELTRLAERDLSVYLRTLTTADEVVDGLATVLPRLVDLYGSAAATLAADWYDDVREAAEARRAFRAAPAELPGPSRTDVLARWAAGPMFAAVPDLVAATSMAAGGLQRIVVNASRFTVTDSAVRDPSSRGWKREGIGDCDFCRMLIGRGAVYTEATASFDSHDRCHCVAVPEF